MKWGRIEYALIVISPKAQSAKGDHEVYEAWPGFILRRSVDHFCDGAPLEIFGGGAICLLEEYFA